MFCYTLSNFALLAEPRVTSWKTNHSDSAKIVFGFLMAVPVVLNIYSQKSMDKRHSVLIIFLVSLCYRVSVIFLVRHTLCMTYLMDKSWWLIHDFMAVSTETREWFVGRVMHACCLYACISQTAWWTFVKLCTAVGYAIF